MTATNIEPSERGPDLIYQEHLHNNNFALPKCTSCNEFHFFPRVVCPHCGGFDLEWQTLSGKGEVYSTSTIRRKPERGGNYNVSLITLEEGPRMMSRIEGIDSETINIGDKVNAVINKDDENAFIVFNLSQEA